MVKIKAIKTGFSLAEVLISMLILSVFFIATSKVITVKPKKEIQTFKHGFFECYINGDTLYQKRGDGSSSGGAEVPVSECTFEPPGGIAYILIYALNTNSEGQVMFYSSLEPIFDSTIKIGTSEDMTVTKYSINHFQEYFDDPGNGTDISVGSENQYALQNYLQSSYPTSSIYNLMTTSTEYRGPAVFFAW